MHRSEEYKEHKLISTYPRRPKNFPLPTWNLIIRNILDDSMIPCQHYLTEYLIDQRVLVEGESSVIFDEGYPNRYQACLNKVRVLDKVIRDIPCSYIFKSMISHISTQLKRTNDRYIRLKRDEAQREKDNSPSLIFKPKFLTKEEWYEFIDWLRFSLRYDHEPDSIGQSLRLMLDRIISTKKESKRLYYKVRIIDILSGYLTYMQINNSKVNNIRACLKNLKGELVK